MTTHTVASIAEAHAEIARLHEALAAAHAELASVYTHDSFGCVTRKGLERKWARRASDQLAVVFSDIDNMHNLNEEIGYAAVDARIADWHVNVQVRDTDSEFGGQYMGGDEFCWVVPAADAEGFAQRVFEAAKKAGLSVTVSHADVASDVFTAAVKAASDICQARKKAGFRGGVFSTAA